MLFEGVGNFLTKGSKKTSLKIDGRKQHTVAGRNPALKKPLECFDSPNNGVNHGCSGALGHQNGCGSKPMGSHFGAGAPILLYVSGD